MARSLERRRKADRERLKRWRKRKLAGGNKQIQLMLSPEAQEVLIREKERTGKSFVHIINQAIIHIEKQGCLHTSEKHSSEQEKMLHRIRQLWSKGYTYSAIADILNNEGATTFKDSKKWQANSVLDLDRKNKP